MKPIDELLEIMAQLRNPKGGCPWDVEQDFASIAPHTLEEAYEVVEAIHQNDMQSLQEELGDLLLQVVFHAQMAKECELFNFDDVARTICEKLVRRHPHVFGDADIKTAEAQTAAWEAIKERERAAGAKPENPSSVLDDVPHALPALMRAQKLQKRAAKVGFDWEKTQDIFAKLDEETAELKEAIEEEHNHAAIAGEVGDLLFVFVNLARRLGVNPEEALSQTNRKFERRFRYVETHAPNLNEMVLKEMDALWNEAKQKEKSDAA